jgi:hypothetical protein
MGRFKQLDELQGVKKRRDAQPGASSPPRPSRPSRPETAGSSPAAAANGSPVPPPPKPGVVDVYFASYDGTFYANDSYGRFQRWAREDLKLLLRRNGYFTTGRHADGLSYLESEMVRIVQDRTVDYAGALGGFDPGLRTIHTSRVLVTRGPERIEAKEGRCDLLSDFFDELLGKQRAVLYGWIKTALQSLRDGPPWRPGQLLCLAGQPKCGKSVCQSLITPLLGGRVSRPYEYLAKGTNFNADIYGAEHGLIGDENHATDNKSRRNFGAAIKKLVVEPCHYIHAKGKTPITLTPFVRLTLSLNDHPSALLVLPSLDSDVKDKIILLRAQAVDFEKRLKRFGSFAAWEAAARAQLPAFVHKLRSWRIPESLADTRYGVVSFHDPDLVQEVDDLSDEERLLALVDTYIFTPVGPDHFSGTSTELEKDLSHAIGPHAALHMAKYSGRFGHLVAVLLKKYPGRIERRRCGGNQWNYLIRKNSIE